MATPCTIIGQVPEKLLSVRELVFYTGLTAQTARSFFQPGGEWYEDGLMVKGDYRLPVSAYNRWLAEKRLAMLS